MIVQGWREYPPRQQQPQQQQQQQRQQHTSSPVIEDGDGDTVENTASGYANLPAELPKGEAKRLKSCGWRGKTLASSRLRGMRERIDDQLEAGSDARALLLEILEEDARQEQ